MTTFEYLAIAYSLLFSATALRLVGGLPHVFRRGHFYWVHATATVVLLCGTVTNFWIFFQYRDVEWTFARFIAMLAIPGNIYFLASMLVPDVPSLVESWRERYYQRRVQFFSGMICWGLLSFANTTIILSMPLDTPVRVGQVGMVMVGIGGLSSARAIVHKLISGCLVALLLMFVLLVVVRPISTVN